MRKHVCHDGLLRKEVMLPEKHCVFCTHCTDVYWDFTNGPYLCFCELYTEPMKEMECFEDDGADHTV